MGRYASAEDKKKQQQKEVSGFLGLSNAETHNEMPAPDLTSSGSLYLPHAVDGPGKVAGAKAVIDVHHRNPGRAAV